MNKSILIVGLVVMLLFAPACLEDLFSPTEEDVLNEGLVGVWYRFSMIEDGVQRGLPALIQLQNNGNGTIEGRDEPDQEALYSDSFIWATDGSTITITDENDSTVWSGSFTLSENNTIVHFTYISEGHSYDEMYVKYTGEKDPDLIGTWIMVDSQVGTEEPLTVQRIVFSPDGNAVDYRIDDLEESQDVNIDPLTWNSSGNYLVMFDEDEQIPMVIQYSITDGVFSGSFYNEDGLTEEFTFVKDGGEIDQEAIGSWTLTAVTIAGSPISTTLLQINLDLNNDMSGTWEMSSTFSGSDTTSFNWNTNSGYMFIYDEDTPLIAWVQEYTISDNILYLKTKTDYYEGSGWVTTEYTFTRSS